MCWNATPNMDSRIPRASPFALRMALRAAIVAALSYVAIQLLLTTHFFATALVVIGLAAVVIADLATIIGRAHRSTQRMLEGLLADGDYGPIVHISTPAQSAPSFERTSQHLAAARTELHQQLDYRQTLLDTVAAALIVVHEDDRITLSNRAAHTLAAAGVKRLDQIAVIGDAGAKRLLALAPGTRQIVSLADGRQMFVSVSRFSTPGQSAKRLISLQRIAGELDAVELKAWQDMVHVLAHEMMNSLTPISSLSESLELLMRAPCESGSVSTTQRSDEITGALDAIKRRSRGLMDFVERYRRFAELPAPQLQRIRMHEFLSGIDRFMAGAFRERRVEYRSRVTPTELSCFGDPQLLEQAVINLLRNAADAVAEVREPRIEVSCHLRETQMLMTIADNGPGLPDHRRDQIFVPFFTTKPGGSGIGLSIARQIALAHGGQLDVWANEPCGAVFALILPVAGGMLEAP
jgi:two-component system nitrogen regulation sensor histidine kinase NtrY